MDQNKFQSSYFDRYRTINRSGRAAGDRRGMFRYWSGYLRRNLSSAPRLLEIGCGLGFFSSYVIQFANYTGLDISEDAVAEAKRRFPDRDFRTGDATRLPAETASADAIVIFDVVEHLPEPGAFFDEASRVLKSGGLLLITTPNIYSLGNRLKDPENPDFKPGMYTDSTHCSLLPPAEWRALLETRGFHIERFETDNLWDIPYSRRIPELLQKLVLVPFNRFVFRFAGGLRWRLGENLVISARRSS